MTLRFTLVAALALLALPLPVLAQPVCTAEQKAAPFDAVAAWSEASQTLQYGYAYWDRIDAPAAVAAATPAFHAATSRSEFAGLLETWLTLFRDGHIHVQPVPSPVRAWLPSAADLWFAQNNGAIVVEAVKAGSDAARAGIVPGWELLTMDGSAPRDAVKARFAPLNVALNPAQELYAVNAMATGFLATPRRFTFRVGRKVRAVDLPAGYNSVQRPKDDLTMQRRPDAAGHEVLTIRFNNSLGNNDVIGLFDSAVATLGDTDHVILDLRDTPGGGNTTVARSIIGHFINGEVPYQRHELTNERAQYTVPRRWIEYVTPRAPALKRAPIVLAGRWTGSMGEGLTIGLDAAANATVIGSEMADLLGGIDSFDLPASCLKITMAHEKLWHVNGMVREDFVPDIPLPHAEATADGNDPALDRAMQVIDHQDRS